VLDLLKTFNFVLDHFQFLLRQEALKLYQKCMKLVRLIEDKKEQEELRGWIRDDFNANKHHTDEVIIFIMHNAVVFHFLFLFHFLLKGNN